MEGIEPLCGRDWVKEHEHDLDGWEPRIEIIGPGSKQTFVVKSGQAMKEVVKVLREDKKRRS